MISVGVLNDGGTGGRSIGWVGWVVVSFIGFTFWAGWTFSINQRYSG